MSFSAKWPIVLGSWLTLMGCNPLRNEINSSQWESAEPPLAITCFLSPQDAVLAVKVSRTTPILGGQSQTSVLENVPDATVKLSQGSQFVKLIYDTKQGFYQVSARLLPIVAGRTYKLNVRTPTGQQATSSCVIPKSVALTRTTFDSTTRFESGHLVTRYFVKAHWQDPVEGPYYYQVTGLFRFVSQNDPPSSTSIPKEGVSYLQFDLPEDEFRVDSGQQSGNMSCGPAYLSSPSTNSEKPTGFGNRYTLAKVSINLLNSSLAYYQYQQAVARQVLASRNPFAEPMPVPTNIEGGVGCFGSYNRSTRVVSLK